MKTKKNCPLIILLILVMSCKDIDLSESDPYQDKFEFIPKNYPELVKGPIKILKERCQDLDGPRHTSSFFNINNKNIIKLEQRKNINNFLLEKAILNVDGDMYYYSVEQYGCSHYGFSVSIELPNDITFTAPKNMISWIKQFQKAENFSNVGKQEISQVFYYIKQDTDFYKTKCSLQKSQINCSSYTDPNNLEISYRNHEIKINYWTVL